MSKQYDKGFFFFGAKYSQKQERSYRGGEESNTPLSRNSEYSYAVGNFTFVQKSHHLALALYFFSLRIFKNILKKLSQNTNNIKTNLKLLNIFLMSNVLLFAMCYVSVVLNPLQFHFLAIISLKCNKSETNLCHLFAESKRWLIYRFIWRGGGGEARGPRHRLNRRFNRSLLNFYKIHF